MALARLSLRETGAFLGRTGPFGQHISGLPQGFGRPSPRSAPSGLPLQSWFPASSSVSLTQAGHSRLSRKPCSGPSACQASAASACGWKQFCP